MDSYLRRNDKATSNVIPAKTVGVSGVSPEKLESRDTIKFNVSEY